MCYHNHTQHNGCGHIGESYTSPWTLCAQAETRLAALRPPSSPPPHPPPSNFYAAPPPSPRYSTMVKDTLKLAKGKGRFGLSRANTTTSASASVSHSYSPFQTRRSVSGPVSPAASFSPVNIGDIPDHEFSAVVCKGSGGSTMRTTVSSEMEVCKECKRWIHEMASMIERYEKTGVIKGTKAFEEFLKYREDSDESTSSTYTR